MRRAIGPGIVFALLGVTLTFGLDAHLWHEFLRHGWDRFRENAEPWVAIGTILLALATTLLAWHTRSEVRIVADQAKASLEGLRYRGRHFKRAPGRSSWMRP